MNIEFTADEARVIGCLIEKEITTPDQYPLSVNALVAACNQKTNREPVLELSEPVVQQTLDGLMKKHMVSDRSAGYGGRVTKYRHRFCNTEFGPLKFSAQELGIICVLLLRGPQTPGELRGRTERLHPFEEIADVLAALQKLMEREPPLVAVLPRHPGTKESRYAHLLSGDVESVAAATIVSLPGSGNADAVDPVNAGHEGRIAQLEAAVNNLKQEVAELKRKFEDLFA